jgi:enterochelin esterase-like enzyme
MRLVRWLPPIGIGIGLGIVILGLSGRAARAQDAPASAKAKEARRPGFAPSLISPEVQADRRVTFRLRAPDAKQVSVSGEWGGGAKAMTREEGGTWSVTLGPLDAGIYGYSFNLDGFQTLDPANPGVKPMRAPRTSILEVPGDPPRIHEFQDVPHGTVRVHEYRSRSLAKRRGLYVYTPPNYDKDASARYPVLYLFHGSGDNEATWAQFGHANLIVDNLLAQGKAKPMIIVMPDGHAAPPRPPGGAAATAGPEGRSRNIADFERDLLEDVMPFVAANYRVRNEAESRAIAGLSMGGGQSLTIGLNHTALFAWVGGFSAAVSDPATSISAALADPKATDSALRLVWIACGKDDRLVENAQRFTEVLKEKGIRHEFQVTEGNHSWPVWRRYLAEFVPRLFVATP